MFGDCLRLALQKRVWSHSDFNEIRAYLQFLVLRFGVNLRTSLSISICVIK
jgi:hypothetical protein